MAKYSYELKMKAIKSHLNGDGGCRSIAQKFGVSNEAIVRRWVNAYRTLGKDGLQRRKKNENYSVQFKIDVIDYRRISGASLQETANHFWLTNVSLVGRWEKDFKNDALKALSKVKGSPSMNKKKQPKINSELTREEELEKQVIALKAELAYVKKLRALSVQIPKHLLENNNQ